jgi:hypothetical protein
MGRRIYCWKHGTGSPAYGRWGDLKCLRCAKERKQEERQRNQVGITRERYETLPAPQRETLGRRREKEDTDHSFLERIYVDCRSDDVFMVELSGDYTLTINPKGELTEITEPGYQNVLPPPWERQL